MDDYQVEKVIGEGSFGKALLCRRVDDRKRCIIKQISLGHLSPKEARQTQQEASLLARLNHPNIVSFWDSFLRGSNLFIVMEFADGGDLDQFLKRRRGRLMNESEVLQLFVQISLAIKHTHDRKVLHRDLKPGNIFLTTSGLVKLGDFGVSKVLKNTGEFAATQIGTPYYMSPEIMDNKRYNSKTDIWSLGCILYEIMCLKLPFEGNSMQQLVQNIQTGNGAVISNNCQYSPCLKDLVKDMLLRNSTLRPGINAILSRPVVKNRISSFLDASVKCREFSHTVIHGMNILAGPAVAPRSSRAARGGQRSPSIGDERPQRRDSGDKDAMNREQERQEVKNMVRKAEAMKLNEASPSRQADRQWDSAEEGRDRREEELLREGLERQKKQIEIARRERDKAEGNKRDLAGRESEREKQIAIALRGKKKDVRSDNEEAVAAAAHQAVERRRSAENEESARRQGRSPKAEADAADIRRGQDGQCDNRKGSAVSAKDEVEKIQKSVKAKENLMRFEKERFERQSKIEKKAVDSAKLQKKRNEELLGLLPVKIQASPGRAQQLPEPPSPSVFRSPIALKPVKAPEESEVPIRIELVSETGEALMKTSSIETAAILRKQSPSRKVSIGQLKLPTGDVRQKYRFVDKDVDPSSGPLNVEVSPFIFSGHACPWNGDVPDKPINPSSEQRMDISMEVAVEYSELFAQMQDILDAYPSNKKQIKMKDVLRCEGLNDDGDNADADDTFGDEDDVE